jgi:hypothetical protein
MSKEIWRTLNMRSNLDVLLPLFFLHCFERHFLTFFLFWNAIGFEMFLFLFLCFYKYFVQSELCYLYLLYKTLSMQKHRNRSFLYSKKSCIDRKSGTRPLLTGPTPIFLARKMRGSCRIRPTNRHWPAGRDVSPWTVVAGAVWPG